MGMISIGDAELSVEITGAGEPLLLVSGLGGQASFWTHQVRPFSDHFQVVTHDHRGTGGSTRSNIAYSVEQMSEDVVRLMDALSISSTALVGHSTGGGIAQHLAINHPDRLSRIVLSASWPGPSQYFRELFKLRQRVLQESGADAYLLDGLLRAYPPQVFDENPTLLTGASEDRLASFPGENIEVSRIQAVLAHDLRDQLSSIDLPTLVIGAKDDQITPAAFFDELAAIIPGAQKVILPFGGHFVPQVRTDEYNDAVLSFLTSAAQGGLHAR